MLCCRDVTRILGGEELEKAPWTRRLAVRFHLILCRHCRRYAAQLRAIGRGARSLLGAEAAEGDEASVRRLEQAILEGAGCGRADRRRPPGGSSPSS